MRLIDDKKKVIFAICIVCLVANLMVLIFPSIYAYQCKNRHFDDFEKKLSENILSSNIEIIKCQEIIESENVTRKAYSVGASGAIFKVNEDTYYALTAFHVVQDYQKAEYFIRTYGAPTYSEYRKERGSFVSNEEYYGQLAKAKILYYDEEFDLAIISFNSKNPLNVLAISECNPKKKERIASIGNPEGETFICTFGNVRSDEYYLFDSKDGLPATQTIKHSAYIANGNSGGMVLNEDMKIVGINIGGGRDIFNRFKYAVMVPCEGIQEFLQESSAL